MDRLSADYIIGVDSFLSFAANYRRYGSKIPCPCVHCGNMRVLLVGLVKDHLFLNGFDPNYVNWIWHGEEIETVTNNEFGHHESDGTQSKSDEEYEDSSINGDSLDGRNDDEYDDFINQVYYQNLNTGSGISNDFLEEFDVPLYDGSKKDSLISCVVGLYRMKAASSWSNKSFDNLLNFISNKMLPSGNALPTSMYSARKLMTKVGLSYEKIHACRNNCVLYKNDIKDRANCPKCGTSRWKSNDNGYGVRVGIPEKVMWYLPIIPRLQRFFANVHSATTMTWHNDSRIKDGFMRHPADSPQWKELDRIFPNFAADPRNIRLGLCTDGFNPFNVQSNQHSTWPILLVIYNIPPWLCTKRKYVILTTMIPGPKQPGNEIDVYMQPLVDDLKRLWNIGVKTWDSRRKEFFTLRAGILWTLSDYPAHGNLAGCVTKGYYGCVVCGENTDSTRLGKCNKQCYMGHRRWLPPSHHFRRKKKAFNNRAELNDPPQRPTGLMINDALENFDVNRDVTFWKRKSILWHLPYWKHLFVRHNLDVMHIEKNICDSVVGTLLNIKGKTKDSYNCRLDMVKMGIRTSLAPKEKNTGVFLPHPCYMLSRAERISICEWFQSVKVPDGFCSNIRSRVRMDGLKLANMKSHDCHVLMQQMLPIAVRGKLNKPVREAITRLCFFFNSLCARVINPQTLDSLQSEIVYVLCLLEMYFPPAFFDVMVHLCVHLVYEVRMCGPVFARWMYPFERYMKVLKGYVRNRYRPEASMVEAYIAEEAVDLCSEVLSEIPAVGLSKNKNDHVTGGGGFLGPTVCIVDATLLKQAHLYVLRNIVEVSTYVEEHMELLRKKSALLRKGPQWVQYEHARTFIEWFSDKIRNALRLEDSNISDTIRLLSYGPNSFVFKYQGFIVNGQRFYTESRDSTTVSQNSGVTLSAESMQVSSAKDQRPHIGSMQFYGKVTDIWELDYCNFTIPVFLCKWADSATGVRVDEMGFTIVDFSRQSHRSDPFILAIQARQVFYLPDPVNPLKVIVVAFKKGHCEGMDDSMNEDQELFVSVPRLFDRSSTAGDDEPDCLGVGEGTTIRKRSYRKEGVHCS